jgi:AraC-like DNA-binding protein
MVCPRCVATVRRIFDELEVEVKSIDLGEVKVSEGLSSTQLEQLARKLAHHGFELLEDQKSKLINQIKSIVVDRIHHQNKSHNINFSTLLADQLHHEYTSLSKLFSSVEGITIEKFILRQKVEKVKELLFYDELTLTEIAFRMNYSSVAHLSNQFKKETGMTPSAFKRLRRPGHQSLDHL